MKKILLIFVAIALVMGTFSCKKPAQKLIGTWGRNVNNIDYVITFSDGGTYTATAGNDSWSDTYSVSGSQITIHSGDCYSDGSYGFSVKGKTLNFATISDGCEGRNEVISGDWSKK